MGTTDEDLKCGFLEGKELVPETQEFTLESGEDKRFVAGVKDTGGGLRTTSCKVEVIQLSGPSDPDNERTLVVKVIKSSGLFG